MKSYKIIFIIICFFFNKVYSQNKLQIKALNTVVNVFDTTFFLPHLFTKHAIVYAFLDSTTSNKYFKMHYLEDVKILKEKSSDINYLTTLSNKQHKLLNRKNWIWKWYKKRFFLAVYYPVIFDNNILIKVEFSAKESTRVCDYYLIFDTNLKLIKYVCLNGVT